MSGERSDSGTPGAQTSRDLCVQVARAGVDPRLRIFLYPY